MMSFPHHRPFLLTAALALLVAGVVASGKAYAECGDYVMVGHQIVATNHAVPESPAPKPCRGPHCSQAPTAPMLPPTVPPSVAPTDWACLLATTNDHPPIGRGVVADDSSFSAVRRATAIFHPPRFSA